MVVSGTLGCSVRLAMPIPSPRVPLLFVSFGSLGYRDIVFQTNTSKIEMGHVSLYNYDLRIMHYYFLEMVEDMLCVEGNSFLFIQINS